MNRRARLTRLAASLLPQWALARLHRRAVRAGRFDPADYWTFWMDASYDRWCRHDRRRNR